MSNRAPATDEFAVFAILCFLSVALIWAAWILATHWYAAIRRSAARQKYDRGYIFAMQSLRAGTYTSEQLLSMSYGIDPDEFDRGVREGVRSYASYGQLNEILESAIKAARNKDEQH